MKEKELEFKEREMAAKLAHEQEMHALDMQIKQQEAAQKAAQQAEQERQAHYEQRESALQETE